jgi:hypothetical protein
LPAGPNKTSHHTLDHILTIGKPRPSARAALAARGSGPHHADPRHGLTDFNIPIRATRLWRWPFASDVEYLVVATVAGSPTLTP